MSVEVAPGPQSRSRWKRKAALGCAVLLLVSVVLGMAVRAWMGYSLQSPRITSIPGTAAGGHAYLYCSGFVDRTCEFYVEGSDSTGGLKRMNSVQFDDVIADTLLISADGQLAVTESSLSQCQAELGAATPTANIDEAELVYSHAFEFTTGEYIHAIDFCAEGMVARQQRHDSIVAMIEAHGGIASRTVVPRSGEGTRPMGFWEWRTWCKKLTK